MRTLVPFTSFLPFTSLSGGELLCGRTWPWKGKPLHPNAVPVMLNSYEQRPVNLWTRMNFLYKSAFHMIFRSD